MIQEHLEYWYDKDGNKIYGDKKHYNKCLEYLLSNNPKDVLSKKGIMIRKILNPIIRGNIQFTSKNKFKIERDTKLPKGRPILFVSTHGFRDDIALAVKTAGKHCYLLCGSIPAFYYSIDGYALWAIGTIVMDRKDKESKKASVEKMDYAFNLGSNLFMCPEGVWNKSKNKLILKLHKGVYYEAVKNNAIIVPIASIQVGNKCYSKRMQPFDITKFEKQEGLDTLRDILATGKWELMEKYAKDSRINIADEKKYWDKFMEELIATSNGLYDYEIEDNAEYVDESTIEEEDVFAPVDNIRVNCSNALVYAKTANACRKKI